MTSIPPPTGEGLVVFLEWAIGKGHVKTGTGKALITAVREVLGSTHGDEAWAAVDVDAIDADDVLRRFETLRAMKYTSGSLRTYASRFTRALEMFAAFRDNPTAWRPNIKPRNRETVAREREPSSHQRAEPTARDFGKAAVPGAESPRALQRGPMITYPFPLRDGVLATLELPADLTRREAARLSAFIDSLALDDALMASTAARTSDDP